MLMMTAAERSLRASAGAGAGSSAVAAAESLGLADDEPSSTTAGVVVDVDAMDGGAGLHAGTSAVDASSVSSGIHGAHGVHGDGGGGESTAVAASSSAAAHPRPVRGRYAKFTAGMDVLLLEAMRAHNPFTAKHGTRLQMWQHIAETVGDELLKNPDAYSWHTCRDRVTTLMKLYADGKHDKLFKHGTVEENMRKESILRELNLLLQRKSLKSGGLRTSALLEGHGGSNASASANSSTNSMLSSAFNGGGTRDRLAGRAVALSGQKRRRAADSKGDNSVGGGGASAEGETFRARVLELIETKIHFDMEQRMKENELREQEFELQKRFLEYLQSK